MDYREAWSYLDDLQFFKIKLGLDSMTAFLAGVGQPQESLKFIHVAGTNGKGSVSANLLTILARAGYKVGLYTSPHLSSVRERFRINDSYISEEEFARQATLIRDSLAGRQITYFEFTTALALLWFAEREVDIVILEVGLGGRLDATNVVTPLLSIITNVSMDHEAHLGNTLIEVAFEKAGVIKPGVPVVSGVTADESLQVVETACLDKGAPLYLLGRDFQHQSTAATHWSFVASPGGRTITGLHSGLAGGYQVANSAVALAALDIIGGKGFPVDDDTIRSALSEVRWPGRLEAFCLSEPELIEMDCPGDGVTQSDFRRYLLDGAHNPAGVEALIEYLRSRDDFNNLLMVWASMGDKDYSPSLAAVAPLCSRLIFTRPEEERSAHPDVLVEALPAEFRERAHSIEGVAEALAKARQIAASNDLICVAGSLYLIGFARTILLGEIVR
ncbi:MAG: folylpolyglutamate synthase/dihydrofolate synthase family protein [Thermodesulfobacteriota bacterium]